MKILLTALLFVHLTLFGQQIRPSQIISLYCEVTNGPTFHLKNTITATNGQTPWTVPKGKTFMLTDISINPLESTNSTNAFFTETRAIRLYTTNGNVGIAATYFNFGYGQVNQSFVTPIPIRENCLIQQDGVGTNGEIILRGWISIND